MRPPSRTRSEFVQLVREFLLAYRALTTVFRDAGPEDVGFDALRALVGDDRESVLFRLKERSHALFRSGDGHASAAVRREALFDLTVGSLFHEAMKLRESLYQREVYAPRIASLRDLPGDDDAEALFGEFERILQRNEARLAEVVCEVRVMLAQTRDQIRELLVERSGERIVTRFLVRERVVVDEAFPGGLEALLEEMHGDFASGLVEAARSLLESAYFNEAIEVLREAEGRGRAGEAEVGSLLRYAEGMQAFLEGDYPRSLGRLEAWSAPPASGLDHVFVRLALAAVSRVDRLVSSEGDTADEDSGAALTARAKQLQVRLETVLG